MSAFAEFYLIAVAIYLWESGLWLPLRSVALRQDWSGGKWRALRPGQWMSTRNLGLVPMIPILPDGNLAPCQVPPLLADEDGNFLVETAGREPIAIRVSGWSDLREEHQRLMVDGLKIRLSSPRALEGLWREKRLGKTPQEAVCKLWRTALSPARARHEWRRWQLVSGPLQPVCFMLTLGFFGLLPAAYLRGGIMPAAATALFLWLLMSLVAARLWWLGGRVYPSVRSSFRTDALLSFLVPFHAMRAVEIASLHAMATTHPAAMILSTGHVENPWLGKFVREILHPRPETPSDLARSTAIRPFLTTALARADRTMEDYEKIPAHSSDPEAVSYCPRCHSLFQENVTNCCDCNGVSLKTLR